MARWSSQTLSSTRCWSWRVRVPGSCFRCPGVSFKASVTESISLDVAHLPYNRKLIQFLQQERKRGRDIYLATGADVRLANRVAEHLGIFKGVLGSDGATNLTGTKKLDRLRTQLDASLGSAAFDYIGNDTPDLPLLAQAAQPMVANPTLGLRIRLRAHHIKPAKEFIEHRSPLRSLLKAVRLHQWSKNLLIFVPLLLSHRLSVPKLLIAFAAFCCFSLTASAAYIVNDLLDIEADRRHHSKRRRPFAAGNLSAIAGVAVIALFLCASAASALALPIVAARLGAPLNPPHSFVAWLILYAVTTTAYSLVLKRVVLVDVIVLAGLYTVRIFAGGAAGDVEVSKWLGGFSVFFFLSLAFVKRFAELESLRHRGLAPTNGRGYLLDDIEQLRAFGTSAAYASVFFLIVYISNLDTHLYRNPGRLWLLLPVLLLWVSQLWLLASRGELNEDPVVYAITDKRSLLLGVLVIAVVLAAL